jgi:hypothetical protein
MSVGSAELHTAGRFPPANTVALVALGLVAAALGTLNVIALAGVLASSPERPHVASTAAAHRPPVARNAQTRAAPSRKPVRRPASEPQVALSRFVGRHFAIDHPADWRVETAEAPTGRYLDTTIRSAKDKWVYLRVDVTPGNGGDPAVHAAEVERYLKPQPGYERIQFRRSKLGNVSAVYWEFTVVESGVPLRKVDVFLTDARGDHVAVLTQAPAATHEAYTPLLDRLRASFDPLA